MTARTADAGHAAAGRARDVLGGVAALAALAALLAGIPIALCLCVGWPLPHTLPGPAGLRTQLTGPIPEQGLIDVLAILVWAGWAVLALAVATETTAAARGRTPATVRGTGLARPLAAYLVGAIVLAALAAWPRPAPTTHLPLTVGLQLRPAASATWQQPTRPPEPTSDGTVHDQAVALVRAAPTGRAYVVRRGDTLWGIADTRLGDPKRWREIAQLNYGRPQPDGRTLTNAHWIYPGWTLHLPVETAAAPPAPPATAHVSPPSVGQSPPAEAPIPQPVPAPASPAPSVPAARPSPPTRPQVTPPRPASTSAAVTLTVGSEIGAAFAAGVLAAMTTARLRRRRAYAPQPVAPAIVADGPPLPTPLRTLLATAGHGHDDAASEEPSTTAAETLIRSVPAGSIEAGTRDGQPVLLDLTAWPGLAIRGSRADDVARSWLGSLLARTGPPGTTIVMSLATRDQLLPDISTDGLPILVLPDNDAVLVHLEAEQLRRNRLLADAETTTVTELRQQHPEDPLPLIVAILDSVDPQRVARWDLIGACARRLDITLLRLDDPRPGTHAFLTVTGDGEVESATPQALLDTLRESRLFRTTAEDLRVLLDPVRAATAQPAPQPDPGTILDLRDGTGGSGSDNGNGNGSSATVVRAPMQHDWAIGSNANSKAPISVRVLGPVTITAWEREIKVGLRDSARELLAWYLLHPDGARAETATDAIWPDAPAGRGPERFWNALGNLRSRLHGRDGQHVEILTKVGDVYRPVPDELDADIWQFQHALAVASRGDDAAPRALARAVDLYRGDFAAGLYSWAEPVREDLHRRALDAHVRLAEIRDENGDSQAAIHVLEHAITLDPVAEDLYRRMIRLLARTGQRDGAGRHWDQLQGRLADINTEPDPATTALIRQVQAGRIRTAGTR